MFGQAAKISHNVASLCQLGPGALNEGGGGWVLGLPPTATRPGHLLLLAGQKPLRVFSCAPCVSLGSVQRCSANTLPHQDQPRLGAVGTQSWRILRDNAC